jgi:hypothetical protein
MKNSDDTIGNRTRDLPVCSAVPQPTALPRISDLLLEASQFQHHIKLYSKCSILIIYIYMYAGLLASSQYPEGPALTGHLGTGLSWFHCV